MENKEFSLKYSEFSKRNSVFKRNVISRQETKHLGSLGAGLVTWACRLTFPGSTASRESGRIIASKRLSLLDS